MRLFHIQASLAGGRTKLVTNLAEEQVWTAVAEFLLKGTLTTPRGARVLRRQAHELKVFTTAESWHTARGETFRDFVKEKRNIYSRFEREVARWLCRRNPTYLLVVVPRIVDLEGKSTPDISLCPQALGGPATYLSVRRAL